MKDILRLIDGQLDKKEDFVLATILKKVGSAPRKEGTKMVVRKDFSIGGTIGGGVSEAMTIKLAAKVFENEQYMIKDFSMSGKESGSMGMVCGGDISVLLEYVDCNDDALCSIYKKAVHLCYENSDFVMITRLPGLKKNIGGTDKWICTETGFYGIENEAVLKVAKKVWEDFARAEISDMSAEGDRYITEPFFNVESVYIYGAGHIAQRIADTTKRLGFYTVVIDDRKEFANIKRFKTADEVKVVPSFNNLTERDIIGYDSYVIVATRGHAYDRDVLAQLLRTDAKYIGMIGSRNKREHVLKGLIKEGFTTEDFERVHCPIGLDINAQTPEEIAISIAAELITIRRRPKDERR